MGVSCTNDQFEKVQLQLSAELDLNLTNNISYKDFYNLVDQFFYSQLRAAAETDPKKEDLLYANAQVVEEVPQDLNRPFESFDTTEF